MSDRNKRLAAFFAFLIAVVLLLLFLKKNPQIVQQVQSALGPQPVETFDVPGAGQYIPRDFPLPAINAGNVNYSSGCNFCSRITARVIPPAMPVPQVAPAPAPSNPVFQPQPFGGGGGYPMGAILTSYS